MRRAFETAAALCLLTSATATISEPAEATDPPVSHVVAFGWMETNFLDPNNPGCSIGSDGSVPGGRLMMGANRRRPDPMNLVIRKAGWLIPAGTAVQIQASFPDGVIIRFDGRGAGQKIDIDIATEQLRAWIHELTTSATMQIVFGGNEPPWTFDLSGSTTVVNAMGDCFRDHRISGVAPPFDDNTIVAGAATQPFSAPQSTQPFGTAAPTKPFGELPRPIEQTVPKAPPVSEAPPVLVQPATSSSAPGAARSNKVVPEYAMWPNAGRALPDCTEAPKAVACHLMNEIYQSHYEGSGDWTLLVWTGGVGPSKFENLSKTICQANLDYFNNRKSYQGDPIVSVCVRQ